MELADILVGPGHEWMKNCSASLMKGPLPWGITVQSVEIRDVVIPGALEDAMSRQASGRAGGTPG